MEPDKDKDITRLMAEALRKQKLPYREGAWERFKEFEAERKRKRTLWPYLSAVAAAAVLVVGVLLTVNQEELPDSGKIARTSVVRPDAPISDMPGSAGKGQPETLPGSSPVRSNYMAYTAPSQEATSRGNEEAEEVLTEQIAAVTVSDKPSSEPVVAGSSGGVESYAAADPSGKEAINDISVSQDSYDVLSRRETEPLIDQESDSRWSFSLELSPNFKNKEVNLGGGVGVSYALSDRLSISSGVSYVALDAERGPNQQDIPQEFSKTSLSNYNYNKSLSNINTSLVGLDIPLNLRFQVNNKMYASAGVSVFNVLEESRYNQFEEHVAVLGFTGNDANGGNPEPVMQTLRTTELSEETPYEGRNFTGFFNFSVGYQLPVLKKLNLAVEPYIKVPIGSLSEQDMDLSNGGLKIKTTF